MNVAEILNNTLSHDAGARTQAESSLQAASNENYPAYMIMLAKELANEGSPDHTRNAAGLAMKNTLTARETGRLNEYAARWLSIDQDTRNKIKDNALFMLASPNGPVRRVSAQLIASIAAIELPQAQWTDVIKVLMQFVHQENNTTLRVAALEAIGFICEQVKPEIMSFSSGDILSTVMHGARKEEPSLDVQLAAMTALRNSLEFIRDNFGTEGERNYIMQVICEATQSPDTRIQVLAFECLARIMQLYYDMMSFYMERALFGLTMLGMKSPAEEVALQAMEFWSTVCEEEYELMLEASEAAEYGEMPEVENKNFARVALPEIAPVLLPLLTQQDEDAEDDEWNISMAAATCLTLLAKATQDNVVQFVVSFIEDHIKSQDWHQREAAMMAFGCILDGPDPAVLSNMVRQALPTLITMMTDSVIHVRDTVAWVLGKICELLVTTIQQDVHLHSIVSALVNGLQDNPRIATNCAWGLMHLADQLGVYPPEDDVPPQASGPLSVYYDGIVQALLKVTEAATNPSQFRTAGYEALGKLAEHAAPDSIPVVQNMALAILARMETLMSVQDQLVDVNDRHNWYDLMTNLCAVLVNVIRRLSDGIQPLADRIMNLMVQFIQAAGKHANALEDAFFVTGSLATALGKAFNPYVQPFLPYLHPALKAYDDPQLCSAAVSLIGDVARALGEQCTLYAEAFMRVLLENLQSGDLDRAAKTPILTCFGDIALAIGPNFEPYASTTLTVLQSASALQPNPLDYEMCEYVSTLRESVIETYTAIVTALKHTDKVSILLPFAPFILDLCQKCLAEDERSDNVAKECYGLIGDLAECFPRGEIKNLLITEWLANELTSKGRMSSETRKTLRWARDHVKRATAAA